MDSSLTSLTFLLSFLNYKQPQRSYDFVKLQNLRSDILSLGLYPLIPQPTVCVRVWLFFMFIAV